MPATSNAASPPSVKTIAALFAASFILDSYMRRPTAQAKPAHVAAPDAAKKRAPAGDRTSVTTKPGDVPNAGQKPIAHPPAAAERRSLFLIGKHLATRIGNDNLTLVAAGVAFYAMTAIFPAIAALVSIYGLFADPHAVEGQIGSLKGLLPPESLKLLTDALRSYAGQNHSTLNTALIISVLLALWSARAGITALMSGLNIANEQFDKRNFLVQQFVAIALTAGGVLAALVAIAFVAILPAIIGFLPLNDTLKQVLGYGRWPVLLVLVAVAMAVLYRFGPYKEHPKWRWITWGAAIATVLWIIGSAAFSYYVSKFGSYNATYGSLAAVVVLLLWFWLSALVVLIGAEIDAELSRVEP